MNVIFAIGCKRYRDPDVSPLQYADQDAKRFVETVMGTQDPDNTEMYLLHDEHENDLFRPTRANVLYFLSQGERRDKSIELDFLFFFFSGHGRSSQDGTDYLLTSDSLVNLPEYTAISVPMLEGHLRNWEAKHVVLFMDACRAEVAGGKFITSPVKSSIDVASLCPPGMVTFCSCKPGQTSFESNEIRSGVFTEGVRRALGDEGRCSTIRELDDYLKAEVLSISQALGLPVQTPYSRIEPLAIQNAVIVSHHTRDTWQGLRHRLPKHPFTETKAQEESLSRQHRAVESARTYEGLKEQDAQRLSNLASRPQLAEFMGSFVRISTEDGIPVGAGFLVSDDGHVMTCAHVVAAALRVSEQDVGDKPLGAVHLDFPFLRSGTRTAHVESWLPPSGSSTNPSGDIAVLRLATTPPSEAQPVLLTAERDMYGHAFRTYGYPRGYDAGVWAYGELRDQLGNDWLQVEDTTETGRRIEQGFSGGPVEDQETGRIVGMVVASTTDKEAKIGFVIPTEALIQAHPQIAVGVSGARTEKPSTVMRLPTSWRKDFAREILESYNWESLAQLLLFELDVHIEHIVSRNATFREAVWQIIAIAEREAWLLAFVEAAYRERNRNPNLKGLYDEVSEYQERAGRERKPESRREVHLKEEVDTARPSRALRVFLCHASGDKPTVRKLYKRLRDEGLKPWLDEEDLVAGQEWQQEIPEAVRKSDVVIICLSHTSVTRAGYVQKEIMHALDVAEEQPEGTIYIIPLKLETLADDEIPKRLRKYHWTNFYEEQGYARLKRALQMRAEQLSPRGSANQ